LHTIVSPIVLFILTIALSVILRFPDLWLPLEIQLLRREDCAPINRFHPATSVYLSQAKTWIFNVMCLDHIFLVFSDLRWEVILRFVNVGVIVDHHCLNFLFIILLLRDQQCFMISPFPLSVYSTIFAKRQCSSLKWWRVKCQN